MPTLEQSAHILDLLPAGVYMVDNNGLIRFFNPRAAELWGREPLITGDRAERYCGALRLFTAEGAEIPLDQCPMVDVLRDGKPRRITHTLIERPDGTRIHVRASISPLRDEAGAVVGAINCFESIDDRVAVERELRRQLEVTRAITDHAAEALFMADLRGMVTFANPAAVAMFGYSQEELRSAPLHDLIHHHHPDGRPYFVRDCPLAAVLAGKSLRDHEDLFFHKSGRPVPVVCSNAPIVHEGRVVAAVTVVRDLSDRCRAQADSRHRAESLKLLSDTATRLLMAERPADVLPSLLESICRHLHCSHYFNYLVVDEDPGDPHLRLAAYSGIDARAAEGIRRLEFGEALCGAAAERGTSIVCEDVQHSGDARAELVRSMGATAYCCHPLVANGHTVGTISFAANDRDRFSPEDLDLLRTVSDQIAMALERTRLNDELRRRNAELTDANAAKDQFLAALSHELRTPLTPVLMAASALEERQGLPDEVREDLSMIRRNVQLEARLIDDLLDLTRITRGKLAIRPEAVDAHDLIRQTIGTCCGGELRDKNLSLTLELHAKGHTVWADPTRLQQVLWNLLKNATKFTPAHGSITVRTRDGAAPAGGQPPLVIEVSDTGIGIPLETLPRVFDAFHQGDRTITRQFGGLGLGLAISKALVDLHHGTLTATSDGPGTGATFTLTLPAVPAPREATYAPAPQSPETSAAASVRRVDAALSVLLVEDHASTADVLARLLRAENYAVSMAPDLKSAVAMCRSTRFDLVISDLGLPDGSGLELLPALNGSRPPRAIALSGYGTDEDVSRSLAAGFDAHLTKPIDLQQLQRTIGEVLARPVAAR